MQKLHVGRKERAGSLDLKKILGFLQIKSQCRGIDFQQLVLRAQRCQRQRRLRSGGDYDVAMRGRASEEKCQCLMNVGIAEPMIVFQEQVDVVIDVSQIIYQMRYDRTWIDQEPLLDQVDRARADSIAGPLQGVSHIEKKGGRLVVVSIDGQPRDCMPTLSNSFYPCRGQRGLAEPRWSRNAGELLSRKLRGRVQKPWTLDH